MESVSTFKSAIPRIRDILRSIAITGMDSMRHICIYLLSRYMTRDKVAMFGLPEELCWENFMDMIRRQNGGKIKALDLFYHPEVEDCLLNHFDNLFDTKKFSFDLKHTKDNKEVNKHAEILEILDKVDMTNIECQMDILGWVYEQHLGTGAKSGRDLGQFFTDRFICEYMTRLCRPAFKSDGVPESVCDPSMGTGGFLAMYIKYYKEHYPDQPVDWSVQQKEIYGCDTDVRVATVARINLFMEMKGARAENLLTQDSLSDDTSLTGYDIILANMPFGLKGLKYTDCSKRIKALKIQGTKSEPLFLQLMMVSLNRGGRCAVVVPDGMLVNQSGCHDGTRKYLLDNFELKRVIKMRGKLFTNTSIQPSILFFENTGNPTTVVEFWDVVKNANDTIEETMVLSVPRERFDASCSLDMRRYQEVKEVANPAGYPMVKLGDLFEIPSIKHRYTNKDSSSAGIPFYNGCYNSPLTCIETDEPSYSSPDKYLIMIKDGGGDHLSPTVGLGKTFITNGAVCVASQNTILVPKNTDNDLKFIYYTLCIRIKEIRDLSNPSINLEHISVKSILGFPIQLPPLAIQTEIVATLDRIYQPGTTELAETLKLTNQAMDLVLSQPNGATLEPIVEAQRLMRKSAQMVADVKAQMVAVVKAIAHGCKTGTTIGNLYDNPSCKKKFNSGDMDNSGDIPFFNGKFNSPVGTHSDYSFDSEHDYFVMIKDGGGDHSSDSVGMGKFFNVKGKTAITSHNLILVPKTFNESLHKFMRIYLYCNGKEIRDKARYSLSLGSISVKDILSFPVPNMTAIQLTNANIRLDALQSQLTALESLQRQSEDNARFILESYLGDSSSVSPSESESEPELEPEPEVRIIRDDAKDERDTGVVYVDPEQVEPVTMTNNGYAATASSTASSTVKVVKCKKPVTSKASKAL